MSSEWNSKEIFKYKDEQITYGDFVDAYTALGIKEGDSIFLQTEFLTFGKLIRKNKETRDQLLRPFVADLKNAVGKSGNLMMTTFSLNPRNGIFNPELTPSDGGILTEFFRKEDGVKRSVHPTHSFALAGSKESLLAIDESTFGDQSIYGKLYHENATLMFWGAGFYYCTFNHFIEEKSNVPYRKKSTRPFPVMLDEEKSMFNLTTYTKSDRYRIDFTNFGKKLIKNGFMKTVEVGGGEITVIKAKDLFDQGMIELIKDPYFFLKVEPFFKFKIRQFKQFVKRILGRK